MFDEATNGVVGSHAIVDTGPCIFGKEVMSDDVAYRERLGACYGPFPGDPSRRSTASSGQVIPAHGS